MPTTPQGDGLNEATLAPATDDRGLSGTGGAEGGGTIAGAGDPSGGDADLDTAALPTDPSRSFRAQSRNGPDASEEAAALGPADGALSDEATPKGQDGTTMGDALRSPGRDIGSGTPGDKGELGGGGPLGQHGGTGPAGAGSPGGDARR